jgi:hypothetical protein
MSLVSILVMLCHLTGTSGGPNSLGDCRVEVGHVSGKQENLDSVSSRVQRSIQMQPPTLATFITPWYGWTSTDSEARKPRSISDKPRMAISLLIKSVFVTPAPNSDAAS